MLQDSKGLTALAINSQERLCIAKASHTESTAFSHMQTNSDSNGMHAT